MPVLIGIVVLVVFGIVYPFLHAHPVVLVAGFVLVLAIAVITLVFVKGLSRRQLAYRTVAPPRRQLTRAMPAPLDPMPRFERPASQPSPIAAVSPESFLPPPEPAVAVISQAGLDEADGECERSGCARKLADGAWELVVADFDEQGSPAEHGHWFCSVGCAGLWKTEDAARRAAV